VNTALHTQTSFQVEYRSPVTQAWLRIHLSRTGQGVALFFAEDANIQGHHDLFRQSTQWYQNLLENLSEHVAILTPGGLLLEINPRSLIDAGVQREEVIGKPFTQFPLWASTPITREQLSIAIEQAGKGENIRFEAIIRTHTGQNSVLAITLTAHRDMNQQVEYLICVGLDITEHAQTEEGLWDLIDAIPHFVWVAQPDGTMIYNNRRLCEYMAMTPQQVQGDGWSTSLHPDDQQRVLAAWQKAVRTDTPYEVEHRVRNGTTGEYRWFLARGMPFKKSQGTTLFWVGTCTDIDEQKRSETALRQSREQVQTLMESNIIGIVVAEDDVVVEANDTFLRMTGYSRDDLRQRKINWIQMTPPEYVARTRQAHQELALQQRMTPYEKEYVGKYGNRLPVLVGGVMTRLNPHQAIYFVLDNSARKELEQRKDDFLNMASHELKTPLAVVKMRTQLARRHLEKQGHPEVAANLAKVEEPIRQIERLIGDLLDVSKIQAGRLEYTYELVDINGLLHEVAETMQQMNQTHTIEMYGPGPLTLVGDKNRLEQVFINLLSNATKYSPPGSTVEVALHTTSEDVTVSIRDHGIGIPQEQCEKIFERFYRVFDPRQGKAPG
ncbi:MAG TPA: PAS domain S-box protein, partial [Ktedonobacteraceae bacterium]